MAEGTRHARLDEFLSKVTTLQETHAALIDKQTASIDFLTNSMKNLQIGLQSMDAKVEQCLRKSVPPQGDAPQPSSLGTQPHCWLQPEPDPTSISRSMRLEVLRFAGDSTLTWISRIQRYFDFYSTPDSQRLIIASFYLDGNALDWYDWMSRNRLISTWKEFLTSIEKRFGPSNGQGVVDCVMGSAREMNDRVRLKSVYNSETESCRKNMAEKVLVESKMEHVACQEMDVCNDFELGTVAGREERDVVMNKTKTNYYVADLAESKPCSPTQVQGAMVRDGVSVSSLPGPFCELQNIEESDYEKSPVKEALNSEKPDPNGVWNGSAMEPGAENHMIGALDRGDLEHCCVTIEVNEAANDFMSNHCPKDKVEETSNDDVYSEVSSQNPSPKHLISSLTSSSHPLDIFAWDPGGCAESSGYKTFVAGETKSTVEVARIPVKYNTYSGRNAQRGGYGRNVIFGDAGAGREFRVVRDNRVNQNASSDSKLVHSSTSRGEGVISNGPVKRNSTGATGRQNSPVGHHSSQTLNDPADLPVKKTKDFKTGDDSKELLVEKSLPTPSADLRVQTMANDSMPYSASSSINSIVGVYSSSSDPVHVPSLHSKPAINVGAIRREVGVVGPRRHLSEISVTSSTFQNTSVSNSQLGRESHSRGSVRPSSGLSKGDQSGQNMVPESSIRGSSTSRSFSSNQSGSRSHHQETGNQKAPQPNKEWKPKIANKPIASSPVVIETPAKTVSPAARPEELSMEPSGIVSVSTPEASGDEPGCSKQLAMRDDSVQDSGFNSPASDAESDSQLTEKKEASSPRNLDNYADAVVTKRTLTEGEILSTTPDASYLMAVTESCWISIFFEFHLEDKVFF